MRWEWFLMTGKARNRKIWGQAAMSQTALVSRRTVVGGTAALLSVVATGRRVRAASMEKLTVRLNWSTEGQHAPFFLSVQKGWFEAAGLDVSIEDGNGSVTTVQLVGNGQFDIGHAALASMAIGAAKGLSVISIAGFVQKGDVGVCVPKESGWSRPTDLIGKRICYTAGSLEGPFVRPFFEKNGVPADKITFVNVEGSAKLSTYLSNNADAVATAVPWLLPILIDKRPSEGILFADFGLNLPGNGLVVQQENLKKRGDAIKRFASVICGAWTYIANGHQEEAVKAIQAARPQGALSAKQLLGQIVAYRPNFHSEATKDMPTGLQSAEDWQKTLNAMESVGVISAGSRPERFFTNDFIDYAYAKKNLPI
jgi:NitT/TauT family transport system substrate-binding protein